MDADEKSQRLLGAIQGYALDVMARPLHEREDRLREIRKQSLEDAKSLGVDDVRAKEWADQVDEWVRRVTPTSRLERLTT